MSPTSPIMLPPSEGVTALLCDKGHLHPEPLGGCAILIVRKDKKVGYEILVKLVFAELEPFNPKRPGPPGPRPRRTVTYAIPSVIRKCGETMRDCALRAALEEAGFKSEKLIIYHRDIFPVIIGNTQVIMLIATPIRSARKEVGEPTRDFYWKATDDLDHIDIFPQFRISGETLREAIDIWEAQLGKGKYDSQTTTGRVKRALSSASEKLFSLRGGEVDQDETNRPND
ncbi:hypothetical protein F5Y16DRAFT_158361 [Xylariaceae sp. FL0255]|nr:hypothetical protein F5Y16DRAFT_158361 [Xylariaceae sp. FL0255]